MTKCRSNKWEVRIRCLTHVSVSVPGKEDLDLGPNDLHLDDFLLSGKFDLIAYADPELNLEDKKDMFNEELDLEPVEEKGGAGGSKKTDSHSPSVGQVKQEVKDIIKTEELTTQPGVVAITRVSGHLGDPGASGTEALTSSPPLTKVGQSLC